MAGWVAVGGSSPSVGMELGLGRSFGIATALEIAYLAGLIAWGTLHPTVPKPGTVIPIHLVSVPPPPKPKAQPRVPPPPPPRPINRPKIVTRPVVPPPKPVVTRPPPPVAPPRGVSVATAIDRYAVLVRTRIQADVRVPSMVRALRERGQALVAFRLTPNGTLLWVKLRKSSGVGPIDAASLRTVKDSLYPPFTPAMPQHPMTFEVKVKISGRPRA